VVTDPVALRGSRWFLGDLYRYDGEGLYFGVPGSNFLGWLLVSLVIVVTFRAVASLPVLGGRVALSARSLRIEEGSRRFIVWLGVALYLGVLLFDLAVTFDIGDLALGFSSLAITLVLVGYIAIRARRSTQSVSYHSLSRKSGPSPARRLRTSR
jgi:uncharacterized membrane protein